MDNIQQFANLTESEKKLALQILGELSKEGTSPKYTELLYADFTEVPVDIITFIKDKQYLGQAWHTPSGKCKLFPYWENKLKELFPDNLTTNYNTAIFSGARGLGKSEVAVACALYLMYRLMCLKNPAEYLNLKPTEKAVFAFMNIKLDLAEEIGISKLQNTVKLSPWFMARGKLTGRTQKIWNPPEFIEIKIGSDSSAVIGLPIYFAFFDEISFIKNQDVEIQKRKAIDMIDTAIGGMKTRFTNKGKNPTLLVLGSSKRSEKSFLESHIKKKQETDNANTLIVDEPVWNVRPASEYSGERFPVALGNKFLQSQVIKGNIKDYSSYTNRGYRILEVPVEYREKFLEDIDRALCDYAGISSSDLSTYISGERWSQIKTSSYVNPFVKDILEIGNAKDDVAQYYNFFDLTKVDPNLKSKPLYIHLDMSISGDKTGIAGVWIVGKKASNPDTPAEKELHYQVAFSVSIKAPKGHQVSFEKNRQFIYWLKEQGFRIRGISTDSFQSADLGQTLTAKGYPYTMISVDRVGTNRICEPYQYFRSTIYEERLTIYDKCDVLTEEIIALERNNNTGKIDHPNNGCFTGDTKVRLTDGRALSFEELVYEYEQGKRNFVYSFNETTKCIEPKPILKAWITGHNRKLIRVTLDNDVSIECTPEHLFMLRDGSYIQAQELLPYDSLMPLYTKYPNKGLVNYRMYYEPMQDAWHYEHRKFANEVYDSKYLVHHKDCNPRNNNPNNLIWMSSAAHKQLHDKLQTGAQSEEAQQKRKQSVTLWHKKNKNSDSYKLRSEHCRQGALRNVSAEQRAKIQAEEAAKLQRRRDIEVYFGVDWSTLTLSEKNSLGGKYTKLNNPAIQEKITEKVKENHKLGKYKNAYAAISNRIWWTNGVNSIYIKADDTPPEGYYRGRVCGSRNHKVVKVEFIDKTADVYDICVQDNHNFALDVGIFVHNSKDCADAVCGAIWNASKNAEQYGFEYGDDLQTVVEVSGKSEQVQREQITVDFEKELRNALDPIARLVDSQPKDRKKQEAANNFMYLHDGIIII